MPQSPAAIAGPDPDDYFDRDDAWFEIKMTLYPDESLRPGTEVNRMGYTNDKRIAAICKQDEDTFSVTAHKFSSYSIGLKRESLAEGKDPNMTPVQTAIEGGFCTQLLIDVLDADQMRPDEEASAVYVRGREGEEEVAAGAESTERSLEAVEEGCSERG